MAAVIQASDIRKGTLIYYEGTPCRVLSFEHRTPGNLRAFIQAKLRSLVDGSQRDVRFASTEMLDRAQLQTREMDYLYFDGSAYVFMDIENYEQHTVSRETLGGAEVWLTENMRVEVQLLEGVPIGIELPKVIEMEIKETEAVVKGQSAARSNKPAILTNGVRVTVPPFVAQGDWIRVDPGEERYIDRVKK
jgi:elongation factor P